jgi:hypothetical protein
MLTIESLTLLELLYQPLIVCFEDTNFLFVLVLEEGLILLLFQLHLVSFSKLPLKSPAPGSHAFADLF